jgi:hypothetical protein
MEVWQHGIEIELLRAFAAPFKERLRAVLRFIAHAPVIIERYVAPTNKTA